MRGLTGREKTLIAVVGVIAVLAIYQTAIVSPSVQRLGQNRESAAQAEQLLAKYRGIVAQENSIISQYKKLNLDSEKKSTHMASVDIVSDLQDLARGLFDFRTIRPTESISSSRGQRALAAECDCIASFDDIIKFLYKLEIEHGSYNLAKMNVSTSATEPDMLRASFYVESKVE